MEDWIYDFIDDDDALVSFVVFFWWLYLLSGIWQFLRLLFKR